MQVNTRRWTFVSLELLLLGLLAVMLALASWRWQTQAKQTAQLQARLTEVLSTQEQARRFDFDRGIYAFCLNLYVDPGLCNEAVRASHNHNVYSNPIYTDGFAPSR